MHHINGENKVFALFTLQLKQLIKLKKRIHFFVELMKNRSNQFLDAFFSVKKELLDL